MRIIGIDPGLGITGFGVIDIEKRTNVKVLDAGVIKTLTKKDITSRLTTIHNEFLSLLTEYKPDVCVLEKLYSHYKHPVTSILMGHARGAICLSCGLKEIPLISLAATKVKKTITGRGNASKMQVSQVICSQLKLAKAPQYYDVTDALALAMGYAQMVQLGR